MSEQQSTNEKPVEADEATEPKPGFFTRIFTKLDESMKAQADAKAKDNCCGGNNGKGGKCC